MDYGLGDIVEMKKQHPCGTNRWEITRMGADIKIKCLKCDNNIMMPRRDFNKKIKIKAFKKLKGLYFLNMENLSLCIIFKEKRDAFYSFIEVIKPKMLVR